MKVQMNVDGIGKKTATILVSMVEGVIGDYRLIIIDNNSDVRPTHPPKTHQDFHQKYRLSHSNPKSSSISFGGIQGGKLQGAALSASCRGIV